MKKVLVTITAQASINYDNMNDETYEEELGTLVSELEEMGLVVTVESEIPTENDVIDDEEM